MDIWEIQERCRAVAGERDERVKAQKAHREAMSESDQNELPRRWLSRAEWEAREAAKQLAYYAHVSEYEGKPRSRYRLKPKRRA